MQNEVITFDKLFARETSSCQERGAAGCLYALLCPAALAEKDDADEHNDGLRNNDGDENAIDAHEGVHGQPPRQRNLQDPETEEIHISGGERVACPVESLQHDHAISEGDIAATEDAKTADGGRNHGGILREQANDPGCKGDKDQPDGAEEEHVP